jgi:16S rRNA processing protein RimM
MGQTGLIEPPIIVVGRIGAPYGIKGWVHIQSFTQPVSNLIQYQQWYLSTAGKWHPVLRVGARLQGKSVVACLEGYETREAAAKLTHVEIGVARTEFKSLKPDEYYWSDLVGLTVINEEGITLGTVVELFETGSNDVLVVKREGKESLIPYLPGDYVLDIDLERKIMQVSWDSEF